MEIRTFLVLGAVLYFVPTAVAFARGVRNAGSVLVVNLFLGWTFLGWVVALAMAARSVERS
ncbi:superinfection immunity protein [Streptomyces hoynatensis]|uniref:Superinfection immunity protein n=1 Tax=Streptomyces hoynatensis TaxID=1141874 RepID=A0A3A9YMJ7_9ACTN|nr:superinfection immunity protein [Streptomyces hoynatensis]RKN37481.1 superinfection immunity protein [Streptomyces hoynatensis]